MVPAVSPTSVALLHFDLLRKICIEDDQAAELQCKHIIHESTRGSLGGEEIVVHRVEDGLDSPHDHVGVAVLLSVVDSAAITH